MRAKKSQHLARLEARQARKPNFHRQLQINRLREQGVQPMRPARRCPRRVIDQYAREHREHPTPAEATLKELLDETMPRIGLAFDTQVVIGHRIADFTIPAKRLVVEVDGPYHLFHRQEDRQRTQELTACGWRVIRFSNDAVLERPQEVIAEIRRACGSEYELASDAYSADQIDIAS